MVQIKLRLKLSRIRYIIKVTYNTFEKATYDQYLMASLALRSKNRAEAYEYIDDITGAGSLNAHFKKLYGNTSSLNESQIHDILKNSLYPILKIDKSNTYDYYPELDISVFKNKIYKGNFGDYENLVDRLYISEKIIESEIVESKKINNSEPYLVKLDNDNICVYFLESWIKISNEIFNDLLDNQISLSSLICCKIHNQANGDGWAMLTDDVINEIYINNNHFYIDKGGDYCLIRNDYVSKTIVSQISNLLIFKEEDIRYEGNKELCNFVLDALINSKAINEFKTRTILTLITYSDELLAQKAINYILGLKDVKELALAGVRLMTNGIIYNWNDNALKSFIKYCDKNMYGVIYNANPELFTDIQLLLALNPALLIDEHRKIVNKYKIDKQTKIDNITQIIGEITISGIREKLKILKSNDKTKRFSKLANKYIGHSKFNYEILSSEEIDKHLKEINEMYELMKVLKDEIK